MYRSARIATAVVFAAFVVNAAIAVPASAAEPARATGPAVHASSGYPCGYDAIPLS
jgi:hypothetical protein